MTSRVLHPVLSAEERESLIEEGRQLFNAGRYYDCHEAWETVWRSTWCSSRPEPKELFRGLIQIAVGFFHFTERQRPDVALRVLTKGSRRVEPLAPKSYGFDIDALLAQVEMWRLWLEAPQRSQRPKLPTCARLIG